MARASPKLFWIGVGGRGQWLPMSPFVYRRVVNFYITWLRCDIMHFYNYLLFSKISLITGNTIDLLVFNRDYIHVFVSCSSWIEVVCYPLGSAGGKERIIFIKHRHKLIYILTHLWDRDFLLCHQILQATFHWHLTPPLKYRFPIPLLRASEIRWSVPKIEDRRSLLQKVTWKHNETLYCIFIIIIIKRWGWNANFGVVPAWFMLSGKNFLENIHWASKETYHFFRVSPTEIQSINMNHIWTQIR